MAVRDLLRAASLRRLFRRRRRSRPLREATPKEHASIDANGALSVREGSIGAAGCNNRVAGLRQHGRRNTGPEIGPDEVPCEESLSAGVAARSIAASNSITPAKDDRSQPDSPGFDGRSPPPGDVPVDVPCVAPQPMALCLVGDALELMMAPGDVLNVKSSGRLNEIGTAHGFMGHVLLVLSAPISILRASGEGHFLQEAWPPGDVEEIWKVRTLESTRAEEGLHEADLLLYVDQSTGQLLLLGEVQIDNTLVLMENEQVELWQSPAELRAQIRVDLMQKVLMEMKINEASWNYVTAARAVLSSARLVGPGPDPERTMDVVRACWKREPICTSVVIIFWQRYLCELAAAGLDITIGGLPPLRHSARPLDLILQWMPLKADRGLPGDLLGAMRTAGWVSVAQVPRIFRPMVFATNPQAGWAIEELEDHALAANSLRNLADRV